MAVTLSMTQVAPLCSEDDLVTAARDGDDGAFEVLYSRYQERIKAYVVSRVHDHARAEDLAQEVFISALRRLRANDQTIVFKPWIYEIAKNACIDEYRRSQRRREVSLDADEQFTSGRRGLLSVAPTPPAAVENKQRLDDLQGAIGGLSESHRRLLMMREFEGLSYDEIGARADMSRQMVESTLFRARRKLTQEYDELASGRRCEQVQSLIETGRARTMSAVGIRERRQLTRHLAHCQPCRREALLAGVDEALLKPRRIAARIAALLPFPIWRWPWGGGAASRRTAARTVSHHLTASQPLPSVSGAVAPAGSSLSLGQAAAAAAALAIAGAGGGVVHGLLSAKHSSRPPVPARPIGHPGSTAGSPGAPPALQPVGPAAAIAVRSRRASAGASPGVTHISRAPTSHSPPVGSSHAASGTPPLSPAPTSASPASPTGSHPIAHVVDGIAPTVSKVARSTVSTVSKVAGSTLPSVSKVAGSTVSSVRAVVRSTVQTLLPAPPTSGTSLGATVQHVVSGVGAVASGTSSTSNASGLPATVTSTAKQLTSTPSNVVSGLLPK